MKQINKSRIILKGHTGQIGEKYIYMEEFLKNMSQNLSKIDIKKGLKIPVHITEDLAYLCGVFAGDGSINYRKSKHEYSLKVVGNPKDEKEFYHLIIGPKFENVFGIFPRMKYHDKATTYGFSVYSKTIYNYLVNFIGLPSGVKYGSLKIPEIFYEDDKLLIAFVRGVFDTDGCISFKKRTKQYKDYPTISVASKSSRFIKQIVEVLQKIGFELWVQYNYKKYDSRIKAGYTIISTININGKPRLKLWMNKIGFYSPKHLEKIKKYGRM